MICIFLCISSVSALDNTTELSKQVDSAEENVIVPVNNDKNILQMGEEAKIVPEGYEYDDDIPEKINYKTDIENDYGLQISVMDEFEDNIPDLKIKLVDANTNQKLLDFVYDDIDAYYCEVVNLGFGTHSCRIIVDDYNITPLDVDITVGKSTPKLSNLKEYYTVKGDYAVLKAKVSDFDKGNVKFSVNGKTYYKPVNSNGVATLKVKMSKSGTIKYYARYAGDVSHNPSAVKKSKIIVYDNSKKSRTISMKGYKVVIPLNKYKKLISAKSNGKTYVFKLNTGKTIKQKFFDYSIGKTKTVKSKVIMWIAFDGAWEYIGSLPPEQYVAELTTSNQHRSGPTVTSKWLLGYKQAKDFKNLNSAKVRGNLYGL